MPESKRHLLLRTFLFQLLHHNFGGEHSIGCDQFVYWNAAEPGRCVAPDAFVKLGAPDSNFRTWKTWERGAPELAVEIVSEWDASERSLLAKVEQYRELGVRELLRFDPEGVAGSRLRAWDRVEGDFVERALDGERTPCVTLGLTWVLSESAADALSLRLEDTTGALLLDAREAETRAREVAEARIRELEEQLARVAR